VIKVQARSVLSIHFISLIFVLLACKRFRQPEMSEVDMIDRRSNLSMVEPIQCDLAKIKERGTLTVLAPYNSTTYFSLPQRTARLRVRVAALLR
jgi:hypothetical protein